MGVDIAMGSRTGDFLLEPPDERKVGIGDPVLQIRRSPVVDCPQSAVQDELLGKTDGRRFAIVVENGVWHLGRLNGFKHALRIVYDRKSTRLNSSHLGISD